MSCTVLVLIPVVYCTVVLFEYVILRTHVVIHVPAQITHNAAVYRIPTFYRQYSRTKNQGNLNTRETYETDKTHNTLFVCAVVRRNIYLTVKRHCTVCTVRMWQ